MTSRIRSIRHAAVAVALAFARLAADCACSEKASVALPRGSACERGLLTAEGWIDGGMVLEAVPLHGVGDRAAWQRDLHEVIAEKNDVLCDIAVMGTEGDFVDSSEYVLEARIGDLCNKVFGSAH